MLVYRKAQEALSACAAAFPGQKHALLKTVLGALGTKGMCGAYEISCTSSCARGADLTPALASLGPGVRGPGGGEGGRARG